VGSRHRLTVALLVAALGTACKDKPSAPPPPSKPNQWSDSDHLSKGEIPQGALKAFTLPLPVDAHVGAHYGPTIHVATSYSLEELASFIRARVKEGQSSAGAVQTRFDNVVAKDDPSRILSIQIERAPATGPYRSHMVVTDVTPLPLDPKETEADRWHNAGLTPDGKLLDPKHMQ
jgi:hypothetical protein